MRRLPEWTFLLLLADDRLLLLTVLPGFRMTKPSENKMTSHEITTNLFNKFIVEQLHCNNGLTAGFLPQSPVCARRSCNIVFENKTSPDLRFYNSTIYMKRYVIDTLTAFWPYQS